MRRATTFWVLWISIFTVTTLAQQDQTKKPTNPDVTSPTPESTRPTMPREEPRPRVLFLTGAVVMADSTELPQSLRVELLCNGRTLQQAHVAPTGHFSFDLGEGSAGKAMPDASVSDWSGGMPGVRGTNDPFGGASSGGFATLGLGRLDLNGCSVRIPPSAGFHSNEIPLRARSVFDNPDIGQILLYRLEASQGTTISLLSLSAPSKARRAYRNAVKEITRKKPDHAKAIGHLEKAVAAYPSYAEAWNLMGNIRLSLNDEDGARSAFQQAMVADEKYLEPYLSLARLELEKMRWAEAAQVAGRLVDLNPHVPASHYFNGLARYYLGELGEAEESFGRLEKEKDFEFYPRTFLFLGMIHARQGRITDAAGELNRYLEIEEESRVSPQLRSQLQAQLRDWESKGLIPESGSPRDN